jgi:protein involved in polysaccharide export with SLBB domain
MFENFDTTSERPEKPVLTEEEKKEYLEKSKNWIYGYEQFQSSPTTFSPASNIPVPPSYTLGPGDKLRIEYFGTENTTTTKYVSRSGAINLPKVGPLVVAGLTFAEAEELIMRRVSSELLGAEVFLSLDELRSISVYVLGEAYMPGSYTVSSLSTLTNLLFVSGGVSEKGSVRNIELKRNGKTIQVFDLYNLLLSGDTTEDIRLADGDVVFIPLLKKTARASGSFRRPHLYEIKEDESIKDLISYAGGFTSGTSSTAKLELNTINSATGKRELFPFSSDQDSFLSREIYDGDSIKVFELNSLESASIKVSGEVPFPGEYSIMKGDTLLDVIERAGGLTDHAFSIGAVFTRKDIALQQKLSFERTADFLEQSIADAITGGNISQISGEAFRPISLLISRLRQTSPVGRLIIEADPIELKTDPFINLFLKDGDELFIPKRPSSVSVVGEIYTPSSHTFKSYTSINEYIRFSGGLRQTADTSEIFIIQPNGESIAIARLSGRSTDLMPGSTIVVPRNTRPFDWLVMAKTLTPILANLATSAAAIAAFDN